MLQSRLHHGRSMTFPYTVASILPSYLATLLDILWDIGAVKINAEEGHLTAFHERYPDAPRSPLYVNLRMRQNPKSGPLTTDEVGRIALALNHLRQDVKVGADWICGIPNAGTPLGRALSRMSEVLYLDIEKTEVDGQRRMFFGSPARPQDGDVVLIVDDVLSEATVKNLVLTLIKKTGATPVLLVFLDRGQGGRARLVGQGHAVHSVLTLETFLGYYLRTSRLSVTAHDACLAYPEQLAVFKAKRGIV